MVIRAIVIAVTTGHVDLGGREAREWAGLSWEMMSGGTLCHGQQRPGAVVNGENDGDSRVVIISHRERQGKGMGCGPMAGKLREQPPRHHQQQSGRVAGSR